MVYQCDEHLRTRRKERLARESGPDQECVDVLKKCMYGTLDASGRWQAHYAQILKGHCFAQGLSNPALFVDVERDLRLLVHGDDFRVEMPIRGGKVV